MSLGQLTTLDAINQFLKSTQTVAFNVATDKRERYRGGHSPMKLANNEAAEQLNSARDHLLKQLRERLKIRV